MPSSNSVRHGTVLRELPVSMGNNANVTMNDRPLTATPSMMFDQANGTPHCSSLDIYMYGTSAAGTTRRCLNLDSRIDGETTSLFLTPPPESPQRRTPTRSSPRKKREASASPEVSVEEVMLLVRSTKRQRTERGKAQNHLEKHLRSLTPPQLSTVISEILDRHPEVEKDLSDLLPEPDIQFHLQQLSELLHSVYRSLPRQRLSSSRSAFCYRRVKTHIFAFKKYCIQQGRHYLACETWQAAIEYSLLAWQHAHYLPKWESPAHNKLKAGCIRGLAGICVEAISQARLSSSYTQQLRPRIEAIAANSSEFTACLRRLDSMNGDTLS